MAFRIPDWLGYEIRERWERVSEKLSVARRWINRQDPRIIMGITAFSVLFLIIVVISMLSGPEVTQIPEYRKAWFYDLNTGKLFTARSDLIPPIEAPSGPLADGKPAGVKAHVFTYAYEPNESERFIGFLETSDPNVIGFGKPKTDSAQNWGHGKLIRRVEDEKWVSGSSEKARAILNEVFGSNEYSQRPRYYPPK